MIWHQPLKPDLSSDLSAPEHGCGSRLKLCVGIASVGRPHVVRGLLTRLEAQTRPADRVVVSVPSAADLGGEVLSFARHRALIGARGLTAQRNAILRELVDADVVCFFDDDFVPDCDYLQAVERAFLDDPALVGVTGHVVADGITGPGFSAADADRMLAAGQGATKPGLRVVYNAYGCNMAFRMDPIRRNRIEFDEQLPVYGWLEDVDFSRRLAPFGRLGRVEAARGVHLGVKGGRQSGRRLGYSQVANPFYLVRKGSYGAPRAAWLVSRNLAMNLIRSIRPEPHVDRFGRLVGNLHAAADLVRGRVHPMRIAMFD